MTYALPGQTYWDRNLHFERTAKAPVPEVSEPNRLRRDLRIMERQVTEAADKLQRLKNYGGNDMLVDAAARDLARYQAMVARQMERIDEAEALEAPALKQAAE